MKNLFVSISILIQLSGCISTAMSVEDKRQLEMKLNNYSLKVIEPIIDSSTAICAYRLEKNEWPSFIGDARDVKLFDSYEVVGERPYKTKFVLKNYKIKWIAIFEKSKENCEYSIMGTNEINNANIKFNRKTNLKEIREIEKGNITKYQADIRKITAFSYLVLSSASENSAIKEDNTKNVKNIVFVSLLCTLMNVSPSNCR